MTTTVNGFRYGEISRKQAGRYAEEGYQQGSFSFRNAMTMYDTGMTRRYPLRTLLPCDENNPDDIETTEIYTIHPFRISDAENFLVGFGIEINTEGEKNNVVIIYYWDGDTFKELKRLRDGQVVPMFATSTFSGTGDNETVAYAVSMLSESVCRGMRFAQYYSRLYVVSHDFRTMYIEYDGTALSAHLVDNFVFNVDAKEKIWFIKGKEDGEGVVLFKKGNEYYEDVKCTKKYTLKSGETPVEASSSYISSFADFEDGDDLNRESGTYPNVVAIINDSLYLANTKLKPSTIWKSRTIGSSQWLKGDDDYSPDTMHDFVQFQVVATEETALKDSSEWPTTEKSGYYETENSVETWYKPDYSSRLYRTAKYWLRYANDLMYYTDAAHTQKYEWDSSIGQPYKKYDQTSGDYLWYYKNGETETQLYTVALIEEYPFITKAEAGQGRVMATDYYWFTDSAKTEKYEPDDTDSSTFPVKKALTMYDLTNASELYEEKTTVDFVATDSCAVRMELNTGANDEVRFISSGCGKIIVGVSTCEKTLPANFNAVSNLYSSHYSSYGSLDIEPIQLGRSFFFFTVGRKIREAYLNDGYMEDEDVTALNHDIFDDEVVDTVGKGTPDPSLLSVLANGKIVQITYDRNGGLNSMARWDNDSFLFKSLAVVRRGDKEVLLALILCEGKYYICYFYEPTEEDMHDNIYFDQVADTNYDYITFVETVYAEVYDNSSVFGRFKKAKTMYIRPYHCGHIQVGNDERQLTTTNYRLEDEDYSLNIMGKMDKSFSMKMQSVGPEPMTILAIAWEA